jgi:hypothetical protein
MWSAAEIAGLLASGVREAEAACVLEQTPLGPDALDETGLHPVLASGLAGGGLAVLREQPYPGAYRSRPLPRERERCDLVVLPEGVTRLVDPLALLREAEARAGTLFAGAGEADGASAAPEDAFWLEVKVIAQYAYVDAVPVPNRAYGSLLVRGPALDLAKLAREAMVEAGGVGVVLFGAEERVVRHDLSVMVTKMLDRDLPIGSPATEVVAIADRAGNCCAGVWVVPLRAVR